ncbi:phage head spike fiber domain-containing protein [Granulicella tundricola]|nr:RHS repeat-associated core domain-containing protein [Granulicella tundricola]
MISLKNCARLVAGFFIISASNLCAQSNPLVNEGSVPIPGVGHNYINGLSETVNPANGSLSLKVDLPTPKGRGISLPFAFTYNSGSVHRFSSLVAGCGGLDSAPCSYNQPTNTDRANAGGGWSDTLPYVTALAWNVQMVNPAATSSSGSYACSISSAYNFYDMQGEAHPLGLAFLSPPEVSVTGGYDPEDHCDSSQLQSNLHSFTSSQSGGDDEVASAAEANCNGLPSENSDCGEGPSFVATDLNGTQYFFPAGQSGVPGYDPHDVTNNYIYPLAIEDRNGNRLAFNVLPNQTNGGLPITDSVGRTIVSVSSSGASAPGAYPYLGTQANQNNSANTMKPLDYNVGGLSYHLDFTSATASYNPPSVRIVNNPGSTYTCNGYFNISEPGFSVLNSITAPNGSAYNFKYDPTFGLVSEVDYPGGGWVRYKWRLSETFSEAANFDGSQGSGSGGQPIPFSGGCLYEYSIPVIDQRTVGYRQGSSAAITQSFSYSTTWNSVGQWLSKTTTVSTTDNISGQKSQTVYSYGPIGRKVQVNEFGLMAVQLPVETSVKDYDLGIAGSSNSTLLRATTKTWSDQYKLTSKTVQLAGAPSSSEVYCFTGDSDLVTEKDEYGFGVSGPQITPVNGGWSVAASANCGSPTPTRKTLLGYGISSMPCLTAIYDGSTRTAETDVYLDGGSSPCLSGSATTQAVGGLVAGTHDEANYGPSVPARRGNPTTVTQWSNNGSSTTTTAVFDETGQIVSSTDGCGNVACADMPGTAGHTTAYSYADNFTDANASGQTNAYVTSVTRPSPNGVPIVLKYGYRYSDGQVSSVTDANNQTTNYTYADSLNRLTETQGPLDASNGNQRPTTAFTYNDAAPSPSITTKMLLNTGGTQLNSVAVQDGIGHTVQTQVTSDPAGTDYVDTAYTGMGSVYSVSSPHRSGFLPTDGTKLFAYDALGREIHQTNTDGSGEWWCYNGISSGSQPNCIGNASSISQGSWVDHSDETGSHWQHVSDSFGRLAAVIEPSPANGTPFLETDYSYDGLNNLKGVNQIGAPGDAPRSRSFSYDSLSRLITSTNPETGTICYGLWSGSTCSGGYDANGNLQYKTDARGKQTSYTYDALNRLHFKTYSDGTPTAAFGYDGKDENGGAIPSSLNSIGRLSHVSNEVNAAKTLSYDAMGRLTSQTECVPSDCSYDIGVSAGYDLAGNMTSLTYPDGRTVQHGFDAAGRMSSVTNLGFSSNVVNQPYLTVATNGYDAAGHLVAAGFGNGVSMGAGYDNRERLLTLGYGPANAPLWSKQYAWTPNSNLQSQTDLITGVQRQFGYDSLNRLTAAQDIFSNLAVASGSNGNTGSTTTSGSGAAETPGGSGAVPQWTNPDDSNLLAELGASQPGWTYTNATVATNAATGPDGLMSAAVVTATSGSQDTYISGTVPNASSYSLETMTGSVWLRSTSGTQTVNLYLVDLSPGNFGIAGWRQVQLTPSWQQYQVTGSMPAALNVISWQIGGGATVSNGQSFMVWNPMLEDEGIAGSSVTNFLPYSQRFSGSTWAANGVSVADNSVTAPDGQKTGATITSTGNGQIDGLVQSPLPYSGLTITGSVWMRVPSGSLSVDLGLYETGSSGFAALNATIVNVTSDWQRFAVTGVTQGSLSLLALQVGGNGHMLAGQVVQVWGAQVEAAATAGPYVATAGIPATINTSFTNLLPYSQTPTGPSWSGQTITTATNSTTAPDGSITAAQISATGADSYLVDSAANPGLYDGATVTGSVYLRSTGGSQTLNLYLFTMNASGRTYFSPQTVNLNSTWQRFQITASLPTGLTALVLQIGGAGSLQSGQVFDVWGAQLEVASHPGPYIATTTLPVLTGTQLTNILPNSQQLNGPNWFLSAGSIAGISGAAPDGTNTASTFVASPNSGDSYLAALAPNPSLYDGETVTASVYLRSNSGTQPINLYLTEIGDQGWQVANSVNLNLSSSWQRVAVTGSLMNGLTNLALQIGGGGSIQNGQGFQVWGPQLVEGSDPAPYTQTTTTTTVIATGQSGTPVPNGLNESYAYDSFGNITKNGSFNASYTANNQMFGYSYDAAGNLLSDGYNVMTWDAESRMLTAGGATYVYDAEGQRVEKQGVGVTDTVYFGGQPIARLSAGQWTDLIYGPNGLLAEVPGTQNGAPVYHVTDQLGTTAGNLLADGTFVNPMDYRPFGGVFSGNTNDPYLFTGKERDAESGLDYFPARYYGSNMGRWMSPDPIPWLGWQHPPEGSSEEEEEESHKKFEEWIGNPQNLNMYAYVNNNPMSHTDPTGMAGCQAGDKKFSTCTITVTYDPKTSKGTLTVTGQNKGDAAPTTLLTASVVVGGDGHVTPTGTFTAKSWEKDHVSTLYGNSANTPWSKTALGGNAFGPYQLHIKELDGRGIFIHGTMGPGWSPTTWGNALFLSPTSHGCIRMCNRDDIDLHSIMPNPAGNKIIIGTTP